MLGRLFSFSKFCQNLKIKIFLFIQTAANLAYPVFANVTDYQFINYSTQDGLSQNQIIDIVEDRHGFIWFGTGFGLNRFDGNEFTVFQHDTGSDNSLPSSLIRKLFIDSQNQLWVGTQNGLAKYDEMKNSFTTYNQGKRGLSGKAILTISEDHNGSLLVSDETGLFRLTDNTFQLVKFRGEELPKNITTILVHGNYTYFGSYGNGLFKLTHKSNKLGKLSPWGTRSIERSQFPQHILDLKVIDDNLWVGSEKGLWVISNDQVIEHHSKQSVSPITGNYVRNIQLEGDSHVWLATEEGITVVNLNDMSNVRITEESSWYSKLTNQFINHVFKDKNNRIWVATESGGVFLFYRELSGLKHFKSIEYHPKTLSGNEIWGIKEDKSGDIWIATYAGGLNKFDVKINSFSRFFEDDGTIIWDLEIDEQNRLWLADGSGIMLFDQSSSETKLTRLIQDHFGLYEILYKNEKLYYSASNHHLNFLDTKNLKVHKTPFEKVSTTNTNPLFFDNNGNLWLYTDSEILVYDVNSSEEVRIISELNGVEVIDLISHENYYKVIGEFGQVFWFSRDHYNLEKIEQLSYNDKPLIISSVVHENNYVWLATDKGIIIFNLDTNLIERQLGSQTVGPSEWTQNVRLLDTNGNVYFGSTNGFLQIHPRRILDTQVTNNYQTLLTQLQIFNEKIENANHYSIDRQPIHLTHEISLSHLDSPFSLVFSQPGHGHQFANFRYKLNGDQNEWLKVPSGQRQATFSNLSPGSYEFEVQSRLENDYWTESRKLTINIIGPWWSSNLAYLMYFLVVIGSIYAFFRYRTTRLRMFNKELSEQVKQRTHTIEKLLEEKKQTFSNISHEFITPISLVKAPLEQLKKSLADESQLQKIDMAQRNMDRLENMVEEVLDLALLDSANNLPKQSYEIQSSIGAICSSYLPISNNKNIKLTWKCERLFYCELIQDSFEKILCNIISNAIKYSQAGGAVDLEVLPYETYCVIRIADNGPGIEDHNLHKIFDKFERLDQGEKTKGFGIGLSLVKQLADLNGGSIKVESKLNKGTIFTINLPGSCSSDFAASKTVSVSKLSPEIGNDKNKVSDQLCSIEKPTILIVEDNIDFQLLIGESLSNDFNAIFAEDGKQGFERAKAEIPDIILTDAMMPERDGYELTRLIRSEELTSHIPVAMLTAKRDFDARVKSWHVEVDDFITKPFNIEELKVRLLRLLKIRARLQKRRKEELSQNLPNPNQAIFDNDRDKQFFERFMKLIEENYAKDSFSKKEASETLALSERQLSRKLSAIANVGFSDFLRTYRLTIARTRIVEGSQITNIAYSVGFSSPAYFSKCFKEEFGISPSDCQKNYHEL